MTPETLRYSINWPSGLSLGEGTLTMSRAADGWQSSFVVEASLPGFTISESVNSSMTAGLCSLALEKNAQRGRRKAEEKTTFDPKAGTATRSNVKGGAKSEISISPCGRDALAYLHFARQQLSQGRVPPASTVLYGAPYQVRMDYAGTQNVRVNEQPTVADKVNVTIKGPQANVTVEAFFAKDAARTPVMVKVPFSVGTFSLELIR